MEQKIFKPHITTSIFGILLSGLLVSLITYGAFTLNNIFFFILSGLLCLFFIWFLYICFVQIFTGKFSLIISPEGIHNNLNIFYKNFIPWSDIEKICVSTSPKTAAIYLIVIHLKNPERFIESQKGWLRKSSAKSNYSKYGSPIIISHTSLDLQTNIYELENILNESYHSFYNN